MTKLLGEAEPDLVDLEEAHLHSEMDESYVRERDSLAMNPFEVMLLMQPLYWPRLEFTLGPRAAEVGSDVWQLDFRERASTAPKATIWNSFRRSVTAAASDLYRESEVVTSRTQLSTGTATVAPMLLQIPHLLNTKLTSSICEPAHVNVSCDGVDRL